jgi:8-oxo-dGTP diphosphatase
MPYSRFQELEASPDHITLRLSVDPVFFTLRNECVQVLLVRRTWDPFSGRWALPGAINPTDEQIEETIRRQKEQIGLGDVWVEQLKTFDRPAQYIGDTLAVPGRDPRGRVISVAYIGLVPQGHDRVSRQEPEYAWRPVDALPSLAFDHAEIVRYALWRLRNKILYSEVAFQLLPPEFTLTTLQRVYEMVLGESLDKRNFRRKMNAAGVVIKTGGVTQKGTGRPARLYRFAQRDFEPVRD